MSFKYISDRQVLQLQALTNSIGSAANTSLDSLFSQIDSVMVNLAGTQTLSNKTLTFLKTNVITDSTTTGSAASLPSGDIADGVVRLTNASLTSISGITAGASGQNITVENQTGNTITINNNDSGASSGNRIYTGTGASISVANNATFSFVYDSTIGFWMVNSVVAPATVPAGFVARNFLINANGGLWQRGTSTTIGSVGSGYQADRFYVYNSIGFPAVITYAQHAATLAQSLYAFDIHVSTAPTSAFNGGIYWRQSLDNPTSMSLYNQTASLSMQIKAQGNVNQVTIAIGYETSETKFSGSGANPSNTIAVQTVSVSTSGFTLGTLNNVALGTSPTTSGTYWVSCSVTGVSSGHFSDVGNGFFIEQPMLNLGTSAAPFATAGANAGEEIAMAQRFYEKSYDPATAPGTSTSAGVYRPIAINASNLYNEMVTFKVTKRTTPTMTAYGQTGTANEWYDANTSSYSGNVGFINTGTGSFEWDCNNAAMATNHFQAEHWTAEADI
jgi:hypothetical protein